MLEVTTSLVGKFWTNEACLEGNSAALRAFTDALSCEKCPIRVILMQDGVNPQPYDRLLSDIVITESEAPISITIEGQTLAICGAPKHLRTLAENIDAIDIGDQSHLEHFPGNTYIAAGSVALVVAHL